jgi:hypothetical protein
MRTNLFPLESITQRIIILRGQKVLLDTDLAALYDVETRRLNEQVRRNQERFPKDFIFELMICVNCETQINAGSFSLFIDKSK